MSVTLAGRDGRVLGDIKDHLRQEAAKLGFHDLRFTALQNSPATAHSLDVFLAQGHHGDMQWMADHRDRRGDPRELWPDARTAIMAVLSYTPDQDPLQALEDKSRSVISVYAQGKDYHDVFKPKLKQLARLVQELAGGDVKVFVDTAPLMEKPLAMKAGLGWQGKHTNLVSRHGGSWFFLGAILATVALTPDEEEQDHCGQCTRCLDICPTKAFPKPYQLDARRCISYLTIEHKGHIAPEFRTAMGNRIYGCDDCLAVCPWNKFAVTAHELRFKARDETANPPLQELLAMDDAAFRKRFAGTAIKRTGRDRMLRNVLIASGNAADTKLTPAIRRLLKDESPLVRAMAVWALSQIADPSFLKADYDDNIHRETDSNVILEWQRALEASQSTQSNLANPENPKNPA